MALKPPLFALCDWISQTEWNAITSHVLDVSRYYRDSMQEDMKSKCADIELIAFSAREMMETFLHATAVPAAEVERWTVVAVHFSAKFHSCAIHEQETIAKWARDLGGADSSAELDSHELCRMEIALFKANGFSVPELRTPIPYTISQIQNTNCNNP